MYKLRYNVGMRQLKENINKVFTAIGFIFIIGIFYFWNHAKDPALEAALDESPAALATVIGKPAADSPAITAASADASKPLDQIGQVQAMNENEFVNWIETESKSLNSTSVNTEEKEVRMKALSNSLTAIQNKKLVQIAIAPEEDANERILASYILTLNTNAESQTNLVEIAKSALPDFGVIAPHSVAEVKRTQELAIRMMAIDALVESAKTAPEAAHKLRLLLVEAESAEIRSYIERKLKELR